MLTSRARLLRPTVVDGFQIKLQAMDMVIMANINSRLDIR
jgi:hypothetical protein